MRTKLKYFEDFKEGEKIFSRLGKTITETDIVMFAGISGDHFELHTNEEYAKKTRFGGRVAHGTLTLGVAIGLLVQTGLFGDNTLAWLGAKELRMTAPVKIGDTLYSEAEVVEKRNVGKDEWGLVSLKVIAKNQRGEIVMEGILNYAIYKRGKSPATKDSS